MGGSRSRAGTLIRTRCSIASEWSRAKVLNAYEPQHLEEYMAEVEADL
jgi:hypothetical protein